MARVLVIALAVLAVCFLESEARVVKRQRRGVVAISPGHLVAAERRRDREEKQDFSKIPGVPGVDYPLFRSVPPTHFDCANVPAHPGMYANVETGCQAYHVCHDGREGHQGAKFLCSNGTLFNQKEFACDWWYNVNCAEAPAYYNLNLDPLKNPYFPKPQPHDELDVYGHKKGAVYAL